MSEQTVQNRLNIGELRQQLADQKGPELWRSLEELGDTPEFQEYLHKEFPRQAAPLESAVDRRGFLKFLGASLALAGLTACARPLSAAEKVVPYVRQPEQIVPGRPLFYASAISAGGYAEGVLVESHQGRPTKLEGNPDHPASLGATDLFGQTSVLDLYDPDRSRTIQHRGEVRTYTAFLGEILTALEGQRGKQGAGLRFLTETITSPTVGAQMRPRIYSDCTMPCCSRGKISRIVACAVESSAGTVEEIVAEMLVTTSSERQGRAIDRDGGAASMEKKKQEGYF